MNREIKFRVWDFEREIFVPEGEIMFKFYGETRIEVVPNCQEYIGDKVHREDYKELRFLISQFTGLQYKNAEIYEGDIIDCEGNKYQCKWNTHRCEFAWYTLSGDYIYPIGDMRTNLESIGNIYQHPHLIS